MNDRTVGSWAWPLVWSGAAIVGLEYAYQRFGAQLWLALIALAALVLFAASIANSWEYFTERNLADLSLRQDALSITADAKLMQEARLLAAQSPDLAAEMARRVGRPDLILYPTRQGRRAQIKIAGSDTTLQFALKALQMSDDVYMVAQRQFGDSTYTFDANREIPDRKQWMQLNWILAREGMVQRYVPNAATNTAPMWLPPWTPQQILDNWLIPPDLVEVLQKHVFDEG